MKFEQTPQASNKPETEISKTPETGILDSLKKNAQRAVQLGVLMGALASAETAEAQTARGVATVPSKPAATQSERASQFQGRESLGGSNPRVSSSERRSNTSGGKTASIPGSAVFPTPEYRITSNTITSKEGRTRNTTTAQVSGHINTPKTGFEKSINDYHKDDPNYRSIKTGYRAGTYSKPVLNVNQQIRGNVRLHSGLTKVPRRK